MIILMILLLVTVLAHENIEGIGNFFQVCIADLVRWLLN